MPKQTARVVVYRTEFCPFCVATARLLEERGITYEEVSLDGRPDRSKVTSGILPGHHTVPLVLVNDEPIGGYDDLRALDASGKLEEIVFDS